MRKLGRSLGTRVPAGTIICLYGTLGAGKTTLTQGVAQGLGLPAREISSASFVLCAEHHGGRLPLYHVDLYRLDEGEVITSGLDEYFSPDGVTVVEWAERAAGILPRKRIDIRITVESRTERRLDLRVPGNLGINGQVLGLTYPEPHVARS